MNKVDIQPRYEVDDGSGLRLSASILKVALDYDYYEQQGHNKSLISQTLTSRVNDYDPKVTRALSELLIVSEEAFRLEEVTLKNLEIGMRLCTRLKIGRWLLGGNFWC